MRHVYVAGDMAELVVGESVEMVSVLGRNGAGYYEVRDSADRAFGVTGGALRPVLPERVEVTDKGFAAIAVSHSRIGGTALIEVAISREEAVQRVWLIPDKADKLADAVRGMARAIRGREER